MTRPVAYIAGVFEHPARVIPDRTVHQIHADVARGAVADAGLTLSDVDGYLGGTETPGFFGITIAEYLGLDVTYLDSTDTGGSSAIVHVGHAASAIAAGKCSVALITLAGRPRSEMNAGMGAGYDGAEDHFERSFGVGAPASIYGMVAQRHMYEFGTTSEQLAAVKVAATYHAQFNPSAFVRTPVSVEEVVQSPMIADPLHRLDCCVVTDGGGALVVVSPEVAATLDRHCIPILGQGETAKHTANGKIDLTYSGGVVSGALAYAEAGLGPADIDYASIYDSFTISVIIALEDLGFAERGRGGRFAEAGELLSPTGRLPFNTDGGGLANNHPNNRGGMTKVIEAVRQLRGEAAPEVQVADCEFALAHGTGGWMGTRMGSSTLILGRGE